MMRALRIVIIAVAFAGLAAACGDDDGADTTTTAAPAETTTTAAETTTTTTTAATPGDDGVLEIELRGFAFAPSSVTVPVGTTIEWVNRDGVDHTTTSSTGEWNQGLAQNDTFRYVADSPGEFDYVCTIHMGMAATLIVEG